MENIEITRYSKAFDGADYKDRHLHIFAKGAYVTATQLQETEEVSDVRVNVNKETKLYFACGTNGSQTFQFGNVTIRLTSDQLDQMIANRTDVTGKNYMDLKALYPDEEIVSA
tara:strand:+ start:151 stop:489 length:339 start_codon:yes stop_codon:yes gene_type:complete